jgi:flagellar hook assembly protein FlgD
MSDLFQRPRSTRGVNRRARPQQTLSIPPLVSVLAVLGVVALLVVMFPLEWFRKPRVVITADQTLFSPNFDGNFDQVTIFYTLSDDAQVTVEARNNLGQPVRGLLTTLKQPAGQHSLTWDGRDNGGNVVPDGVYTVFIQAAGVLQKSEGNVNVTVDNTPPPLVLANFPATQTIKSDKIEIQGSTAPDAIVHINNEPSTVPVSSNGVFNVTRQLKEGDNTLVITAADAAGNTTSAKSDITVRTEPPVIQLSGPAADSWLNSTIATVSGTVPADAKVTVNGNAAQVGPDGFFKIDVVLQDGDNILHIVATDPVGNAATEERVVHVRSHGPVITLLNLPDGLSVADATLRVVGKVDPGASVTVNGSAAPADAQGNFSATLALRPGQNVVTFVSNDQAGNATTLTRQVTYAVEQPSAFALPQFSGDDLLPRLGLGGLTLALGGLIFAFYLRRPMNLKLEVDKTTFYPNQPGDASFVAVRVTLSRAARVTLVVRDQMDREVLALVENRNYHAGQHLRLWNGRANLGQVAPGGVYQVEATASAFLSSTVNSAVWVQLDSSAPALGRPTASEAAVRRSFGEGGDSGQVIDGSRPGPN